MQQLNYKDIFMGLFDDARRYDGEYYRQFSQAIGSDDLNTYFGDSAIAKSGVCSASSLFWIRHYLSRDALYTNQQMSRESQDIATVQEAIRYRGQSLRGLLMSCGMKPRANHLFEYAFDQSEAEGVSALICASEGVTVLSYTHPVMGRHVVASYVKPQTKRFFFIDVQKGDVWVDYPNSKAWLLRYLQIFHASCGNITATHFEHHWDEIQFQQELRQLYRESLKFNPVVMGVSRTKAGDDFNIALRNPV